MHTITLKIEEGRYDEILEIMAACHLNEEGLINDALTLHQAVAKGILAGKKIAFVDENLLKDPRCQEVSTTGLENILNKP